MRIFFLLLFLLNSPSYSYVPTVDSLFRHGGNPDVNLNSVVINLKLMKDHGEGDEVSEAGYFKVIISKVGDAFHISQAQFQNESFSDSAMVAKSYLSSYSPFALRDDRAQIEKGMFWGVLDCVFFNQSKTLINFLKILGTPVQLNGDILNKEKIEYLVEYKKYLVGQTKNSKRKELNPLKPDDYQERLKIEKVMGESMYVDLKQVQLVKNAEDVFWGVEAGNFQATVDYVLRHPINLKYKAGSQTVEIHLNDYLKFDGTHYAPSEIMVKNLDGESYRLNLLKVRYFSEKEDEVLKRIQKWESLTKDKNAIFNKPVFFI